MTQKYFSCRIADLLPRVNSDILIPSIQRPYVWEPEQIVKLFDSLLRGYPINTFLLWHLEPSHFGDLEIYRFVKNFRHGDVHNDAASVDGKQPLTLVLDGQQRLTSLLIGLDGTYTVKNGSRGRGAAWVEKVLMINLVQSPEDDGEEDDDGFTVRELYYGLKFFAVDRVPKNDRDAVWFKVPRILQITDKDQLAASIDTLLLLNPDLSEEARKTVDANLRRLWQVVHEEDCLAYYLEREQSYDKVLDIFVRANDGGTKLSRSDLLMSMVTLRWDRFNARSETEAITYRMREMLQQEAAFDRDYLLRCGLFFNDLDFAFQLRNFTPRNIALIEARWPAIKQAILMSGELFRSFGITGGALTGVNAVMLLGCYIFKRNAGKPVEDWQVEPADIHGMRRWISAVLFHGVLSGAANVTMEFYRRALNEQLKQSTAFPVAELTSRITIRGRSMVFNEEAAGRFAAMESKHRIFQPSVACLYERDDWSAKNWQAVAVIPSHRLLDDRLRVQGVPADEIPAYQSWAHRLANYIILSDQEASEYFSMDLDDWVATRPAQFWSRHLLPSDPALYQEFSFLAFIQARKRLIAAHLEQLLIDRTAESASSISMPDAQPTLSPPIPEST